MIEEARVRVPDQAQKTLKKPVVNTLLNCAGEIMGKGLFGKKLEKALAWNRAENVVISSGIAYNLKKEKKYLDIGSGPGHIGQLLRRMGFDITSCDPFVKPFASVRKEQQSEGSLSLLSEAQHLPFKIDFFEGAMVNFVLHHIPPQDWLIVFDEIERVIKPGGRLILIEDVPLEAGDRATSIWDNWTNGEIFNLLKNLIFRGKASQNLEIKQPILSLIAAGMISDLHLTDDQWKQIFEEKKWELVESKEFFSHDPVTKKDIRHEKFVLRMPN